MVVIFRADQAVTKHEVFESAVAHTIAAASFSDCIRSVGHGFHAAGYHDVSIAEFDFLGSQGSSTHAGAAEFVDCESRYILRNAGMEQYLTSRVFTAASLEYVAHDNFVDLIRSDTSAFNSFRHSRDAQINSRYISKATIEATYRGTCSTYDYSFSHLKNHPF